MSVPILADNFDTAIRLVELIVLLGGGGTVIFKLGSAVTKFELIGTQQAGEISELKKQVEGLGKIITAMAVEKTRLDGHADRLNRVEKQLDELRHGEGYVLPIKSAYEK